MEWHIEDGSPKKLTPKRATLMFFNKWEYSVDSTEQRRKTTSQK